MDDYLITIEKYEHSESSCSTNTPAVRLKIEAASHEDASAFGDALALQMSPQENHNQSYYWSNVEVVAS